MNTVSTTTPSQREANTIAFAQAASTMFAMDTMLTRRLDHLKMPRPAAYNSSSAKLAISASFRVRLCGRRRNISLPLLKSQHGKIGTESRV